MQVFSFVPKTDAEITELQNRDLLPDGIYSFIVRNATLGVSKANNSMFIVQLAIVHETGSVRIIKDFLIANEEMIFKLKHFCEAIGLEEDYRNGALILEKMNGRSGQLKLGIQKGKQKEDKSGFYPDKNNVKDYIKGTVEQKTLANEAPLNQDVPF